MSTTKATPVPEVGSTQARAHADSWSPKLSYAWQGIDRRAVGVTMPRLLFRLNEFLPKAAPIGTQEYTTLLILAQARKQSNGLAQISTATLARRLGKKPRYAAHLVKQLAERGFLLVLPPTETCRSNSYDLTPTMALIGKALDAIDAGGRDMARFEPPTGEAFLLIEAAIKPDIMAEHIAQMRAFASATPIKPKPDGSQTPNLDCQLLPTRTRKHHSAQTFTARSVEEAVGIGRRICAQNHAARSGRPALTLMIQGKKAGTFRITMKQQASGTVETWVSYRENPDYDAA